MDKLVRLSWFVYRGTDIAVALLKQVIIHRNWEFLMKRCKVRRTKSLPNLCTGVVDEVFLRR